MANSHETSPILRSSNPNSYANTDPLEQPSSSSNFDLAGGMSVNTSPNNYINNVTSTNHGSLDLSMQLDNDSSSSSAYHYIMIDEQAYERGAVLGMIFALVFLSSLCYSSVLSAVFHVVCVLGEPPPMMGWIIAAHGAGALVAAPIMDVWAFKRPLREVFLGSLVIIVLGNVIYTFSEDIYMVIGSRFIIGFGSMNQQVALAFVRNIPAKKLRHMASSYCTIASVFGFMVGSLATSLCSRVKAIPLSMSFDLDGPSLSGALAAGVSLVLLVPVTCISLKSGKPRPTSIYNSVTAYHLLPGLQANNDNNNTDYIVFDGSSDDSFFKIVSSIIQKQYFLPRRLVVLCLLCSFIMTTSCSMWEIAVPRLTLKYFGWHTFENGILYAGMGLLSVASLVVQNTLISPEWLLTISSFALTLGFSSLFLYQQFGPDIIFVAAPLISMGFSSGMAALTLAYGRLFRRAVMKRPPPFVAALCWMTTCGNLGRIVGPLLGAYLFDQGPNELAYIITTTGLSAFGCLCTLLFWWFITCTLPS